MTDAMQMLLTQPREFKRRRVHETVEKVVGNEDEKVGEALVTPQETGSRSLLEQEGNLTKEGAGASLKP